VNEWLKLMLEEIRRKQREQADAQRERDRRAMAPSAPEDTPRGPAADLPGQD
jgi:hypothetical protein